MSSTRLPGKILLPLGKRTVIEMMLHRLSAFKNNIIIATNNDGTQSPLVNKMLNLGFKVYQGDTENVLERFILALRREHADPEATVVRLTSDCPFMDADLLTKMIDAFKKERVDYLSNTLNRTFARGVDIEIMSVASLEKAYEKATTSFEKEHVTPYIHTTHKLEFSHYSYEALDDTSHFRITLDEDDDYTLLKRLINRVGEDASYVQIVDALTADSKLAKINQNVEQKKC